MLHPVTVPFKWLSSKCKHLALWLTWVTKTELLLTISILYQAEKWWELRKMLIRGWLANPVQNSNSNHKNCLADNRENYQWDLERKRVKCYILLQLKFHWILLLVHNSFPVIGAHFGDGLYMFWHYILCSSFTICTIFFYRNIQANFYIAVFYLCHILRRFTCCQK